jgi:hypothetical protein
MEPDIWPAMKNEPPEAVRFTLGKEDEPAQHEPDWLPPDLYTFVLVPSENEGSTCMISPTWIYGTVYLDMMNTVGL